MTGRPSSVPQAVTAASNEGGRSKVWRPSAFDTRVPAIWRFFSLVSGVWLIFIGVSLKLLVRSMTYRAHWPEMAVFRPFSWFGPASSRQLGQFSTDQRLELINSQPRAVRRAALALLDQVSRPMTVREIEHELRRAGVSRSQSAKMAGALKQCAIIAIVPPDSPADAEGDRK